MGHMPTPSPRLQLNQRLPQSHRNTQCVATHLGQNFWSALLVWGTLICMHHVWNQLGAAVCPETCQPLGRWPPKPHADACGLAAWLLVSLYSRSILCQVAGPTPIHTLEKKKLDVWKSSSQTQPPPWSRDDRKQADKIETTKYTLNMIFHDVHFYFIQKSFSET